MYNQGNPSPSRMPVPTTSTTPPIGVFDSGVGGLSILSAIRTQFPSLPLIYVADQIHVPYGPRSLEEVRAFSVAITRFLLEQGAQLVVVACNTASAAALHHLRATFPETPFVGMEPAVKPAAEKTRSGVVGVLATPATFQGALYASVVERFAQGVTLIPDTCPGLVTQIEAGELDAPQTHRILEQALRPMLAAGIDTIVLGCTHYPYVTAQIARIAGPGVRIIDPAPAIAHQVGRVLGFNAGVNAPEKERGTVVLYTTGPVERLQTILPNFWHEPAQVLPLRWVGEALTY
jgi:glutamate racemase